MVTRVEVSKLINYHKLFSNLLLFYNMRQVFSQCWIAVDEFNLGFVLELWIIILHHVRRQLNHNTVTHTYICNTNISHLMHPKIKWNIYSFVRWFTITLSTDSLQKSLRQFFIFCGSKNIFYFFHFLKNKKSTFFYMTLTVQLTHFQMTKYYVTYYHFCHIS